MAVNKIDNKKYGKFLRTNGRTITLGDVAELFGRAQNWTKERLKDFTLPEFTLSIEISSQTTIFWQLKMMKDQPITKTVIINWLNQAFN